MDHRTHQVKGEAVAVRPARDEERVVVDMYRAAFAVQLDRVDLPRSTTLRYEHWP